MVKRKLEALRQQAHKSIEEMKDLLTCCHLWDGHVHSDEIVWIQPDLAGFHSGFLLGGRLSWDSKRFPGIRLTCK